MKGYDIARDVYVDLQDMKINILRFREILVQARKLLGKSIQPKRKKNTKEASFNQNGNNYIKNRSPSGHSGFMMQSKFDSVYTHCQKHKPFINDKKL